MYIFKNERGTCTMSNIPPKNEIVIEVTRHFDFEQAYIVCANKFEEILKTVEEVLAEGNSLYFEKVHYPTQAAELEKEE